MNPLDSDPWPTEENEARALDRACDRFEAAWRDSTPGCRPALVDFLPPVGSSSRSAWFRELFEVEVEYRRRAGESIPAEEYREQFPEFATLLGAALLQQALVGSGLLNDPASAKTLHEPVTDSPTDAPAVQIAGYEIERVLGRGGMGVVYLARQTHFKRLVALKVILSGSEATPEERARFRTEAEAVARLNHPGIVQVHDAGEWQPATGRPVPYLVMEYCPGGNLAAYLAGVPQTPVHAAALAEELARSVQAAHAAGVIHRDLKPANVLLDAHGRPKVTDFGLAKTVDSADGLTRTGAVLGSPSYMAPEQARGDAGRVGPAADVYALGAILYEMLTGQPPFKAVTVVETLDQVRDKEPVPPRAFQPALSRDLETITLKCLEKNPARRYASAGELADDLARWREGRPIVARRAGLAERAWRWARRHQALAALYAVSALAVLALLGFGFWFSARLGAARVELDAVQARLEAEAARADAARVREDSARTLGLLSEARALISRRRTGWTWPALAKLGEAARLLPSADNPVEMRSDAAECLTAVDIRPTAVLAEDVVPMSIAWQPDGKRVALGARALNLLVPNFSITLVDPADPQQTRTLYAPQKRVRAGVGLSPDHPNRLAYSPEGRWLVAGMRSGMLHAWDLDQAQPRATSWAGHEESVAGLVFSRDGTSLYSSGGKKVCRWLSDSWTPAASATLADRVGEIDIHPTEGWLALSGGPVQCLNADSLQPFRPHLSLSGNHVAFSPDGRTLLAGDGAGMVQVYPVEGDEITRQLSGPVGRQGRLSDLALGAEGVLLLTASDLAMDRHARLWDLASGRLLAEMPTGDNGKVAFSPDGRAFAVTSDRGTRVYELGGLRERTYAGLHSEQPIQSFALSADGRTLICEACRELAGALSELTSWSLNSPGTSWRQGRKVYKGTGEPALLTVSPTTGMLAYTYPGQDCPLRLWHPNDERAVTAESLSDCRHLRFAPDGALWGAVSDQVRVWDESGRPQASYRHRAGLGTVLTGKPGVRAVAPGRRVAVAVCRDGSLAVLERAGGVLHQRVLTSLSDVSLRCVTLSADEQMAAAGTEGGEVILVEVPSGKKLLEVEAHADTVTAVDWSCTGLLASADRVGRIRVWRWQGDQLREVLSFQHDRPVRQAAFHPDGVRLFVLLEGDWAVRVYHLDRLRAQLERLALGGSDVGSIRPVPLTPPLASRPPAVVATGPEGSHGLKAEFFASAYFRGLRHVRYNSLVDFDRGKTPLDPQVPEGAFSARWTGWLRAPKPGRHLLALDTASRGRLWLDGVLVLDSLHAAGQTEVELSARPHEIRVELTTLEETARMHLLWSAAGGEPHGIGSAFLFHDRGAAERASIPPASVKLEAVRTFQGPRESPGRVAFGTEGRRVSAGSSNGELFIWDSSTGKELSRLQAPRDRGPCRWAITPDLRHAATSYQNGPVLVWDLATGKVVRELTGEFERASPALAFSSEGDRLVAGGSSPGHGFTVWETRTGKRLWTQTTGAQVNDGIWCEKGNPFWTWIHREPIRAWLPGQGEPLRTVPGTDERYDSFCPSADGQRVAVGRRDSGRLALLSANSGKPFWEVESGHGPKELKAITWSPDGKYLATAGANGVSLRDAATGAELRHVAEQGEYCSAIAFSPDGTHLLIGSDRPGKHLQLWRLSAGKK